VEFRAFFDRLRFFIIRQWNERRYMDI
jgi:hypothetical protein